MIGFYMIHRCEITETQNFRIGTFVLFSLPLLSTSKSAKIRLFRITFRVLLILSCVICRSKYDLWTSLCVCFLYRSTITVWCWPMTKPVTFLSSQYMPPKFLMNSFALCFWLFKSCILFALRKNKTRRNNEDAKNYLHKNS